MDIHAILASGLQTFLDTFGNQLVATIKTVVSESAKGFVEEIENTLNDPETIKEIAPAVCLVMAAFWCLKEISKLEKEC